MPYSKLTPPSTFIIIRYHPIFRLSIASLSKLGTENRRRKVLISRLFAKYIEDACRRLTGTICELNLKCVEQYKQFHRFRSSLILDVT
jgi:hypothetical protein